MILLQQLQAGVSMLHSLQRRPQYVPIATGVSSHNVVRNCLFFSAPDPCAIVNVFKLQSAITIIVSVSVRPASPRDIIQAWYFYIGDSLLSVISYQTYLARTKLHH